MIKKELDNKALTKDHKELYQMNQGPKIKKCNLIIMEQLLHL